MSKNNEFSLILGQLEDNWDNEINGESDNENHGQNTAFSSTGEGGILIGLDTSDFVRKRIENLQKNLSKIPQKTSIKMVDNDVLYPLLEESTQLSMVLRKGIVEKQNNFVAPSENSELILSGNVVVGVPQNTVLCVSLPPIIGRKFKGSYNVYWDVKYALERFKKDNILKVNKHSKKLLIYKKFTPDLGIFQTCDNDNWEAKRVTNAISEAMDLSDNAEHFSMLYTAVQSEFEYVEAVVIEQSKLPLFVNYINQNASLQPLE